MRLHVAEVLHQLDHKPLLLVPGCITDAMVFPATDKTRKRIVGEIRSAIHQAQKFIFNSGSDQDPRTVDAVRETAVNMMEAGLFHLPHPTIWIEDPFTDDPNDLLRNYYLATERDDRIIVRLIQRVDLAGSTSSIQKNMPSIMLHTVELVIHLDTPTDKFTVSGGSEIDAVTEKTLGEAIYSLKKLIVVLNTTNLEINKVQKPGKGVWGGDPRNRPYDHSIIRVPLDRTTTGDFIRDASGLPRSKILVRGYQWGRHTRPLSEQRWIKPHFRGEKEDIVTTGQRHYEVR